jgi:hypothetical protein
MSLRGMPACRSFGAGRKRRSNLLEIEIYISLLAMTDKYIITFYSVFIRVNL